MLEKVENLEAFNHRLALIQSTIHQIKKDFQWYDEDLSIDEADQDIVGKLKLKLTVLVNRMLELDTYRFFQLMYTIDIPEEQVRNCLMNEANESGIEELVELIIKRELQKVLIREHFKGQG